MQKPAAPQFIDLSVRKGSGRTLYRLLTQQVCGIVQGLASAGLRHAEVSHGRGLGAQQFGFPGLQDDREMLEAARKIAPSLIYSVYIVPKPYSLEAIEPLSDLFEIGRVGVNIDEASQAEQALALLKRCGKQAFVQLSRVHARPLQTTQEALRHLENMGADAVFLTDHFGSMSAEDVARYIEAAQEVSRLPLGFQAHNRSGRAIDNSLTAWRRGAAWLDASLLGMGPGAGLASLESLVTCLQMAGACQNISVERLTQTARWEALPALHSLPYVGHLDLLFARHRLDYFPEHFLKKLASILEVDLDTLMTELRQQNPEAVQVTNDDLRRYLAQHRLDFDVVLKFLRTGEIAQS